MEKFIEKNYDTMTYKVMAKELGISFDRLSKMVKLLIAEGKIKGKNKKWSIEDDRFLLENYDKYSKREIGEILGTARNNVINRYSKFTSGILIRPDDRKELELEQYKTEDERITKLYQEIMSRTEPKEGIIIDNLKLTIGKKYSIRIPRREGSTSFEYFIGTLMQECKNHLVFKNSKGICESFLKVDLLLEHEYKEVN